MHCISQRAVGGRFLVGAALQTQCRDDATRPALAAAHEEHRTAQTRERERERGAVADGRHSNRWGYRESVGGGDGDDQWITSHALAHLILLSLTHSDRSADMASAHQPDDAAVVAIAAAPSPSAPRTAIQIMAEFATSTRFHHLPPAVVQLACRALADSLACALAAASQPEIQAMAR